MYILKKYPNWRSLTETLPTLSTFLAGFSLNLMLLSLRTETKSVPLRVLKVTLNSQEVALVFLSFATLLFIYAVQCILRSRSYNYFDIKPGLISKMETEAKNMQGDLEPYIAQMDIKCKAWYTWGANLFNIASVLMLVGAATLIYPYSILVMYLFTAGIIIEIFWMILDRH